MLLAVDVDGLLMLPGDRPFVPFSLEVLRERRAPRRNGADNPPAPFAACAFTGAGTGLSGVTPSPPSRSCCSPLSCAQVCAFRCCAQPLPQIVVLEEHAGLDVGEGSAGLGVGEIGEDPVVPLPVLGPRAVQSSSMAPHHPLLVEEGGGCLRFGLAKIYVGRSRHWVVVWLWFLS
ncbi:hypothetical protein ACVWXU_008687 [Streptomyces sp. TE33382]